MQNYSPNTAVLFFSRSAEKEAQYKRFTRASHNNENAKIANSLIEHTLHQIKRSGFPYFVFDEQRQVGDTFGERFSNAFCAIFEKGFDHVIAVGNDIPQLKKSHIQKAAQQLGSGVADIVLGPDSDGGTWLMGYSRDVFEAGRFEQLPWTTPKLRGAIFEQADDTIKIDLLETLSDIDDPHALKAFAQKTFFDIPLLKLIHQLSSILSICYRKQRSGSFIPLPILFFRNNLLRAPPVR